MQRYAYRKQCSNRRVSGSIGRDHESCELYYSIPLKLYLLVDVLLIEGKVEKYYRRAQFPHNSSTGRRPQKKKKNIQSPIKLAVLLLIC